MPNRLQAKDEIDHHQQRAHHAGRPGERGQFHAWMLTQQPHEVEEAALTRKTGAGWMDCGGFKADALPQKGGSVISASTPFRLGSRGLMAAFSLLLFR